MVVVMMIIDDVDDDVSHRKYSIQYISTHM